MGRELRVGPDYSGARRRFWRFRKPPGPDLCSVTGPFRDLSRAVLITNTLSGVNRRHGVEGVHAHAEAAGLRHYRVDDVDALDAVLRECARADIRLIVVNAGDGTVCRVLDAIRTGGWFVEEPVLALLRGGTTNMIHHDVGWRGRPETALRVMLSCLQAERCTRRERSVLQVHQAATGITRRGFFFGTHAVVRAIRRTRARLHNRGLSGAMSEVLAVAAMLWRLLWRRVEHDPVLSPIPLEIRRSEEPWQAVAHILLMATTLRRMILGLRPLARGQRAGLAELNWPGYQLRPWMWCFARGRLEALQSISLRGELTWVLDGEIYDHRAADGTLEVTVDQPAHFLVRSGDS